MANLSKASNIVQEKYDLYDVTSFTQKWHSIPVATNCIRPARTRPFSFWPVLAVSKTAGPCNAQVRRGAGSSGAAGLLP